MKKRIVLVFCLILSAFSLVLLKGVKSYELEQDDRISITKPLDSKNVAFRNGEQTNMIFDFEPGDSVKIKCKDLVNLIYEEKIQVILKTGTGRDVIISDEDIGSNKWISIDSRSGKFGIIFIPLKDIVLSQLEVFRKSRPILAEEEGGIPMTMVDAKTLLIPNDIKSTELLQMEYDLRRGDHITVIIRDVSGNLNTNLVCNWHKVGEEFAREPLPNNTEMVMNDIVDYKARYVLEFGNLKMEKGEEYFYYIKVIINRRRKEVEEIVEIPEDSTEKLDLFDSITPMKVIFDTPESELISEIPGIYNIKTGINSRTCFEIPLTEETSASIEGCFGCESYWAYWFGAGEGVINAYQFYDADREKEGKNAQVRAFFEAEIVKKVNGSGVFRKMDAEEDIYYAILEEEEAKRFLDQPFEPGSYKSDSGYSFVPLFFTHAGYNVMRYSPQKKIHLCVCNNNHISSVPILFKFQQFLVQPDTNSRIIYKPDMINVK